MKLRRLLDTVAAYALIALLIAVAIKLTQGQKPVIEGPAFAIDGDTLVLHGERVRLIGIDAPELDQTCRVGEAIMPCGRQSREAMRALIRAGVRCESHGRDRYGRLLASCTAGGGDLAARMVADGQAVAEACCRTEEAAARAARRGIWAGSFERPADWRRERRGADGAATQ